MPPRKGNPKPLDLVRKAKRDAERRRRAKIKADPVKYEAALRKERERRKRRKETKKILSIEDLTPREQRAKRKEWKERQQKSRANKKQRQQILERFLRESTPSTHDETTENDEVELPGPSTRNNSPLVGPSKQNNPQFTPLYSPRTSQRGGTPSSVDSSRGSTMSTISRQRLYGLKQTRLHREMTNRLIQKQQAVIKGMKQRIKVLQQKYSRLANQIPPRSRILNKQKSCSVLIRKAAIRTFLEQDINSKVCPGKKDTVTKGKLKKQKRVFCDSLQRLHMKYNQQAAPGTKVSYATFCRLRPFWIVRAKLTERDTCLCTTCENAKLLVEKLRSLNMISPTNVEELCASVVCDDKSYNCMSQKCSVCSGKIPRFLEFEDELITHMQWVVKTETRLIRGKEKNIPRTIRENKECQKKDLVNNLTEMLPKILKHRFNIQKQYTSVKIIKDNLKPGHILLHIDFSENYCCKYFSEIQSVHFGASRQQISLHTGILYFKPDCSSSNSDAAIEHIAFCTVSECLRHDAAAVYAHLKKALFHLIKDQNVRVLHVTSDGPSSQYKNKNNFYLFTQHLLSALNISEATWNFTESGHGKGPADGVGAAIKRTADSYVCHGNDIPDFNTFFEVLKIQSNVILYHVTEEEIKEGETILGNSKGVKTIPGTKIMHQLTWSRNEPHMINLRESTCNDCKIKDKCPHFTSIKKSIAKPTNGNRIDENVVNIAKDGAAIHHPIDEASAFVYDDNVNNFDNVTIREETVMDPSILRVGAWILAKFEGKKKQISSFVGQITSIDDDAETPFLVKFTRKKTASNSSVMLFNWKEPEDSSLLSPKDIVCVLPEPTPGRRGDLLFNFDFTKCEYPIF